MTEDPVESGLGQYWEMVERVKAIDLSGRTDLQLIAPARTSRAIIQLSRQTAILSTSPAYISCGPL
jgi:hypothetical protein